MDKWEFMTLAYIIILFLFNIIVTIATTVGGGFDVVYLFKTLKKETLDETDDGRVDKAVCDKE